MFFIGENTSAGESIRCLPQRQSALFYMASILLHRKIPERVSLELLYFNLLNIIPHMEEEPCHEELLSRSYKCPLIRL
jgi:recombinational DNA repair protein (RecF pathway)